MCNIQLRENDARACGMMSYTTTWNLLLIDTVDAVVSEHPQDVDKVSGHLRESLRGNIKIQSLYWS